MLPDVTIGMWAKSGGAPLPYDAEVEWLETDGNAMIDSGVSFAGEVVDETQFEISAKFDIATEPRVSGLVYFGRVPAYGYGLIYFHSKRGLIAIGGYYNTPYMKQLQAKSAVEFSCLTIAGNKLSCRYGEDVFELPRIADTNVYLDQVSCPAFGYKVHSQTSSVMIRGAIVGSRVYYSHIKNLRTGAEFDGIPVRVGNVGYMYDRISGQLFGNANTRGAFVIGPDKVGMKVAGWGGYKCIRFSLNRSSRRYLSSCARLWKEAA